MPYLRCLVVALSILLAGCSGSGGDASTSSVATSDAGSLTVIVDTRADEDAWVQFQVAGVTLERADGLQTANLLRESQILTVGDPSGEPAGLRFAWAPVGRYEAMHLMLAPGSGVALDAAGNSLMVTSPLDIRIPITDGFEHSPTSASWLLVGHDVAPLTILGAVATWFPRMSARLDGAEVQFDALSLPVVRNEELAVTAALAQDGTLLVDAAPACVYRDLDGDEYASRAAFLADIEVTDDLCVVGNLRRNGRIDADLICRKAGYGDSRLIGRVLELDAANQRFKLRVQAVNPRGRGVQLQAPQEVWVRTDNARIESTNGLSLPFASLASGNLVKVKWDVFEVVANGLDVYFATEVAISSGTRREHQPQWQARVVGVDLVLGFIEIEPRNNEPLRLRGYAVPAATVIVDGNTRMERRGPGGPQAIGLAEIRPGVDRILVRGRVVGPATIEAARVRVREE